MTTWERASLVGYGLAIGALAIFSPEFLMQVLGVSVAALLLLGGVCGWMDDD